MSPTPLLARLLQRHGLQSATFGSLFDIVGQSRSTFISQHGREFGEQAANLYDDALRQAVPLARRYREQRLSGPAALSAIKTEADLYEYLLIDTRVATDVTTSRVAQAIASVQQYINATLLNMEPGRKPLPADDVADWAQSGSQYAIWAGDQELQDYPENYIDPTLRENRTGLFSLLETQLSAHALTDTSIQDGFLAYLAGFETISNLKVLNGYAESPDTSNAVYYLVGQSNIMPNKFYWRSLDMSKRDSSGALNPTAWSEWNDIELAQSADIEVIRPFVSGGRLHLVWLQVGELPQTGPDTPEADADSEYRLCCAYLGFDGNWSVPHTLASWTQLTSTNSASTPVSTTGDASLYDYQLIAVIDSLTLPATVGPYQDIRATLAQTSSSVLLTADIAGVQYLLDSTQGSATNVMTNLRPSQQIVLSTGLNDAGQFVLDMHDQRYLPFEGTGAVSNWRLTFPHASSTDQTNLISSLTDIIVQLRYTAKDGGPAFAKAVIGALAPPAASGRAAKAGAATTRH